MNRKIFSCLVSLVGALGHTQVHGTDLDARLKGFVTLNDLPGSDLQRDVSGSPALDGNLDLRLMLRSDFGRHWELVVDHSTIGLAGDGYEFSESSRGAIDQTPTNDDFRALELTWTLDGDNRHRLYHRFDRLALRYRANDWNLTLGREAVSWGSGKVFNPMDLFAPFAPTTVDRDYKPGVDLAMANRRLENGDIQLLGVFRRDGEGGRDLDYDSFGLKWQHFFGGREVEIALGRHYQDDVAAISFRQPLGGALLQTDWVWTRLDAGGDTRVSGVVNLDYSLDLAGRTSYLFVEYFRNGFGRNGNPVELANLPEALVDRLQRGEVFNLMKDYLAIGGSYQWHPLWVQNLTWLNNLHDDSGLLQSNVTFEPGDHLRLEAGVTLTAGERGDEYGRIAVGEGFTTGGGNRVFLRWTYFW